MRSDLHNGAGQAQPPINLSKAMTAVPAIFARLVAVISSNKSPQYGLIGKWCCGHGARVSNCARKSNKHALSRKKEWSGRTKESI